MRQDLLTEWKMKVSLAKPTMLVNAKFWRALGNRFYAGLQMRSFFVSCAHVQLKYTSLVASKSSHFRRDLKPIKTVRHCERASSERLRKAQSEPKKKRARQSIVPSLRTASSAVVLFAMTAVTSLAHAQSPMLDKAEAYLNGITTLTTNFSQIAPDGALAQGKLYLKRPGKMRWDYSPPTPVLMVSDGETLVYIDEEMDEVSYLGIDDTLAAVIAKPNFDFDDPDLQVSDVEHHAGMLRFTLRRTADPMDGALTMVLKSEPMQLYQLLMEDASGGVTRITLDGIQRGMTLDDKLFRYNRKMLETR